MGRMIDIAPRASTTNGDGPSRRINTSVFNRGQVDDQTIIANSQASGVVSATADCEKQIIFSRKFTERITSATSTQRAIARGFLCIIPL